MTLEMQGQSSDRYTMDWLWLSLYHALAMLWATFWALVLGFTISGVLQVFVSKEQISRAFGQTNLKSVPLATGLGAAEQLLFVCGGCGGAECDSARCGRHSSTGVYVRLHQPGDRARGRALGFDGVAVCVHGNLWRATLILIMWLLIRSFLPKTLEAQIRQRAVNHTREN